MSIAATVVTSMSRIVAVRSRFGGAGIARSSGSGASASAAENGGGLGVRVEEGSAGTELGDGGVARGSIAMAARFAHFEPKQTAGRSLAEGAGVAALCPETHSAGRGSAPPPTTRLPSSASLPTLAQWCPLPT
jgi:hypothetical protein